MKQKTKTLQIKWKGNKFEQAVIKKAECSLIRNGIKCTNIKINHLQTGIANTKTSLQQKLDEPTIANLQNTIFNNKEKTFLQYKNTQLKLMYLTSRACTTTPRWPPRQPTLLTLLSALLLPQVSRTEPSQEVTKTWRKSLLQKGPKFAVT